jgi:hypothetical protein
MLAYRCRKLLVRGAGKNLQLVRQVHYVSEGIFETLYHVRGSVQKNKKTISPSARYQLTSKSQISP